MKQIASRHSLTGERFRDMDNDLLRRVMRRTYKFAADTSKDQRGAQIELQRRRKTVSTEDHH